jgi:hypothetical protein
MGIYSSIFFYGWGFLAIIGRNGRPIDRDCPDGAILWLYWGFARNNGGHNAFYGGHGGGICFSGCFGNRCFGATLLQCGSAQA